MGKPTDLLEADPRKWSLVEISGSAMICKGPSCIGHIHVSPETPKTAYICDIYNGESVMAELKFSITGVNDAHDESPVIPFYFERGIYVDFVSHVGSVTIQFNPIRV